MRLKLKFMFRIDWLIKVIENNFISDSKFLKNI